MKQPCTYIVTNIRNGTLYTGVTSQLRNRAWQHRNAAIPGFTTKYACKRLVWYQLHPTLESAILHEKQIKAGSRMKKLILIESLNPEWQDLYHDLI